MFLDSVENNFYVMLPIASGRVIVNINFKQIPNLNIRTTFASY